MQPFMHSSFCVAGLARDVYNSDAGQYQANVGYKTSNPTAYVGGFVA